MGSPPAPVSVVVLTWNSERTIDACLRSLAGQSLAPAEVLIVDDDSTDSTLDRAQSLAGSLALPLRVLRNGAHNISRGRNIGIDASRSPIVAFLDSDAYADEHWVEAITASFARDVPPAVVGGEVVAAHASRFAEALAVSDTAVRDNFAKGTLLISGCNMAVNVPLLDGARFDEAFVHAEDIEFVHRACRTHPSAVAGDAIVHHESRVDPRGYLRQMYRYGAWKVRYSRRTGDFRLIDYVPSVVILMSLVVSPLVPLALLAFPALCVAEAAFVMLFRRPPFRLAPAITLGWIVKNLGWGLGVLRGLAGQPASVGTELRPAAV